MQQHGMLLHVRPYTQVPAAGKFADEVRCGDVPGIRVIKRRLRLGQPKVQEVREYLTALANL